MLLWSRPDRLRVLALNELTPFFILGEHIGEHFTVLLPFSRLILFAFLSVLK